MYDIITGHRGQLGLLAFEFHQQAEKLHIHIHEYFFFKSELIKPKPINQTKILKSLTLSWF